MSGYINTMADLERQTYGLTGHTGINNQLLKAAGTLMVFMQDMMQQHKQILQLE